MMNRITMSGLGLLIGLALAAVPLTASAQCIEVTPGNCDYGKVKVGAGETENFTIHSCATSALTIYYIGIVEGAFEAFPVSSVPDVPFPLPGGRHWTSRSPSPHQALESMKPLSALYMTPLGAKSVLTSSAWVSGGGDASECRQHRSGGLRVTQESRSG
jgi:hypothetical protein